MPTFAERGSTEQIEEGPLLSPKFDANGLVTAVATDADTGEVLMVAFMNEEALQQTIATREAHFYSRSRKKQWKKGESSGHVLQVKQMLVDCDQDCVWMRVKVTNDGGACHVGYNSCFYREVDLGQPSDGPAKLKFTYDQKKYDPKQVYGKK